jgi:hypothetical protein
MHSSRVHIEHNKIHNMYYKNTATECTKQSPPNAQRNSQHVVQRHIHRMHSSSGGRGGGTERTKKGKLNAQQLNLTNMVQKSEPSLQH